MFQKHKFEPHSIDLRSVTKEDFQDISIYCAAGCQRDEFFQSPETGSCIYNNWLCKYTIFF